MRSIRRAAGAAWLMILAAAQARSAGITTGPYLQNPTIHGITICWVTDAPTVGTITYRPIGVESRRGLRTVRASAARYHRVRVTGLAPHTRYRYQVSDSGQVAGGTFLTAARGNQPFKFVAYGDCRSQPDRHAEVLSRIRIFDPDFIIQTGDLVANGENQSQWHVFWKVAGPTLRNIAYFPALGNHERHGAPYFNYFAVPAEYSFDYGCVHFVALDSNRPASEYAAQEAWLRQDLAKHQGATWRVVFFHHTPYTCVDIFGRRELAALLRARLEPLFLAGHVQVVVNGHDHGYQHHFAHGIHYIVTGGGGAPLYPFTPDTPFVRVAKSAYHDCEIEVDGPLMSVRAIEPDGTVIDRFTVRAR